MKHANWLLLGILCSAMLVFAQDKGKKVSGTICNSACVTTQAGLATCDLACTDKSGDTVCVSDSGNVMKIANPEMAMPHMKKHVNMMAMSMNPDTGTMAAPSEKEREQQIRIMEIYEQAP
jgi:hypothetical protein